MAGISVLPCCCGGGDPGQCNNNPSAFSDDFNRADSTDLGSGWLELAGSWQIQSGSLVCSDAGAKVRVSNYFIQQLYSETHLRLTGSSGTVLRIAYGVDSPSSTDVIVELRFAGATDGNLLRVRKISQANSTDDLVFECPVSLAAGEEVLFRACRGFIWLNDFLVGHTSVVTNATVRPGFHLVSPGASGVSVNSVIFHYDQAFDRTVANNCKPCVSGLCGWPSGATMQTKMAVTISGVETFVDPAFPASPTVCPPGYCEKINGTWVLDYQTTDVNFRCLWELQTESPPSCFNPLEFRGVIVRFQVFPGFSAESGIGRLEAFDNVSPSLKGGYFAVTDVGHPDAADHGGCGNSDLLNNGPTATPLVNTQPPQEFNQRQRCEYNNLQVTVHTI